MEYCVATLNARREKEMCAEYMADALYIMTRLLANGKEVIKQFKDVIHPPKADTRNGAEIAEDIIARHGLKVVG